MASRISLLRKVPANPVVFFYESDNDPMPLVQVMKLQHEKDNPGFLGINLNYVKPEHKELIMNYYKSLVLLAGETINLDHFRSPEIEKLTNGALRSYNYSKIKEFVYRGNRQDHNRK